MVSSFFKNTIKKGVKNQAGCNPSLKGGNKLKFERDVGGLMVSRNDFKGLSHIS